MRKWALGLGLLALSLSRAPIASADTYQIGGPAGAAVWASYDGQMATQAVILTLSDAGRPNGDGSGARCTFSILQWGFTPSGLTFRQFYGDAALPGDALSLPTDLSTGALDAEVKGTLVEQVGFNYKMRKDVSCRLKCDWTPTGDASNGYSSWTYQVLGYGAALQANIVGKPATCRGQATLDGLSFPLGETRWGSLATVVGGALSVSVK
jgi:hypothetical protein